MEEECEGIGESERTDRRIGGRKNVKRIGGRVRRTGGI